MNDATSLAARVAHIFRDAPPNGWLLGWDRNRFALEIKKLSHPGEFENVTSFDYSFCNSFEITFRQTPHEFVVLTVRISFVDTYYATHWTQYVSDGRDGEVIRIVNSESAIKVNDRVREFLRLKGFRELPEQWESIVVPDAKLELSEGLATLGKCLFDDYA